jgi:hypothetical protein
VPTALLDAMLDRITALDLLDGLVPILRSERPRVRSQCGQWR